MRHILTQDARKSSEAAGMRMPASERSFDRESQAVGTDRAPRLNECQVHIAFRVVCIDRADRSLFLDQEIEKHVERIGFS